MQTFNYMVITEENGLGEARYRGYLIRPWYKGGNHTIKWASPSGNNLYNDWSNKERLIENIKQDAGCRRRKPLRKFRVVLKEPMKA